MGNHKGQGRFAKKLESLGIDNKKTIVFYSDIFKGRAPMAELSGS